MPNSKEQMVDVRKSSEAIWAKSRQAVIRGRALKKAGAKALSKRRREALIRRMFFPK